MLFVRVVDIRVCDAELMSLSVQGMSSSAAWYAVFDFGVNFCNLKNLIYGTELDNDSLYTETSNNTVCTMYSLAHCNVY